MLSGQHRDSKILNPFHSDVKDVSHLENLQTKSLTKRNVGLNRNLVGDIVSIGRFRIANVVP